MQRVMTMLAVAALFGGLGACAGTRTDGGGGASGDPFGLPGNEPPPPAQGAARFTVTSAAPVPAGKSCPVVDATVGIPQVSAMQALDADTYLRHIVDGEDAASFRCRVSGASTFTFAGAMQRAGTSLEIGNGMLGADHQGTADIKLGAASTLPGVLASGGSCTVDAAAGMGANFQVKPGSIWASFSCSSVEAAPSDFCAATGFFVLENCEQ